MEYMILAISTLAFVTGFLCGAFIVAEVIRHHYW